MRLFAVAALVCPVTNDFIHPQYGHQHQHQGVLHSDDDLEIKDDKHWMIWQSIIATMILFGILIILRIASRCIIEQQHKKKYSWWQEISNLYHQYLEDSMGRYGALVASHPFISITFCFLITGLSLVGIINYRTENNAFKLWIPQSSDFSNNYAWLEDNFPPDIRFNSLLLVSDGGNILTPGVLAHMARLREKVDNIRTGSGLGWRDYCHELPVSSHDLPPFSDINTECLGPEAPWLVPCYPSGWCSLVDKITEKKCFEKSLLELWTFTDPMEYAYLSHQMILDKLNEKGLESSIFNTQINVTDYLGDVEYNSTGHIVSAKATFMKWFGKINISDINKDDVSSVGLGEIVDDQSLEFEKSLLELLIEDGENMTEGIYSYINVARAFSDLAGETILNDVYMMPLGFLFMFIYVQIMLGKFNCVEQRSILALCGLASIGLTIGFTYGFCSGMGLFFGPMHNMIPFLLLGLGVDDMFVIMQCYDNLITKEIHTGDIVSRISLTMRKAGLAVTVTSLTDFMVFAIGSITDLPALRSFCLWCGVGILTVYFFQLTLFIACLTLDCRRVANNRNGMWPCVKERDTLKIKEKKASQSSLSQRMFNIFATIIFSVPGKISVLLMSVCLFCGGIQGCRLLRQEFDHTWFLPSNSSLSQWFTFNSLYFPNEGETVTVYMTDIEWTKEMNKIERLVNNLTNATDIIRSVDSWYPPFKEFLNTQLGDNVPNITDRTKFSNHLTQFLFNPDPAMSGFPYQPNFKFTSHLVCGEPAPDILLSTFTFTHVQFNGRDEHIPALHRIKQIIKDCDFSGKVFALTQEYSSWETDEVITKELLRNLSIALICVFLTTFILMVNFLSSVLVLFCVSITLVDLCGYMHFWGLTIDVVSAVNVIIAIGLSIDYSVHICYSFLTQSGSRRDRAVSALSEMGTAVLNGGVSALVAFIPLAGSDSHVFSTFFKIFFLVVVFGIWHGLLLLPVLLSLVGPTSIHHSAPIGHQLKLGDIVLQAMGKGS